MPGFEPGRFGNGGPGRGGGGGGGLPGTGEGGARRVHPDIMQPGVDDDDLSGSMYG